LSTGDVKKVKGEDRLCFLLYAVARVGRGNVTYTRVHIYVAFT